MDITKSYGLDRIWINAEVAERLGIADGDEVILSNTMAEGPIKVKVTERINPTAIYMPSHYGCKSPDQRTAYGVGLNFMGFVPHGTGLWLGHDAGDVGFRAESR